MQRWSRVIQRAISRLCDRFAARFVLHAGYNLQFQVQASLSAGVPKEQLVAGVAWYGREWCACDTSHFMGELTAQVRISDFSNRKTWYENARVCGMTECHKRFRFHTSFCSRKTRKSKPERLALS